MRFQNALENARVSIKILLIALCFSFIINLCLMLGWHRSQQKIEVYIPPQIPTTGLVQKANEVLPTTVYSFAYYIWQSINYWPQNGAEDYKKSIEQFSAFLTPRFKNFLIKDYNERFNQGELQERLRNLQGLNGTAFEAKDVEYIGHDTWLVHLHLRLNEHMNMNANQVKDVAIDYTLRIVRYEVNSKINPWGLAIDGFVTNPQRIQTFI